MKVSKVGRSFSERELLVGIARQQVYIFLWRDIQDFLGFFI